jgi:hypothetical protein
MQKQKKQKRKRRNRKGENYLIFQFLAEKCVYGEMQDILKAIDMWELIIITDIRNYGNCYHIDSTIRAAIQFYCRKWLAKKLWGYTSWPYELIRNDSDALIEYRRDVSVNDIARLMAVKTNFVIRELLRKDRKVKRNTWLQDAKDRLQGLLGERRYGFAVDESRDRFFISNQFGYSIETQIMLRELCEIAKCENLDDLVEKIESNVIDDAMMEIIKEYIVDLIKVSDALSSFVSYIQSE